MASSQANMHNIISMQFLEACYLSGEMNLAKKVSDALKKDLQQQLDYYLSLGDENYKEEQLVNNAYMIMQGKAADLSDRQLYFAQDILSSYQILQQLAGWEKQYAVKSHT
jgi:hypothetical protein